MENLNYMRQVSSIHQSIYILKSFAIILLRKYEQGLTTESKISKKIIAMRLSFS